MSTPLQAIVSETDTAARQAILWGYMAEVQTRSGDSSAATEARRRANALRAALPQ